jgi:DNA-binding XRE family transcriptional regulator
MGELTLKQKRDYARILYCEHSSTQKETAQKVGVQEKTVAGWREKENWDDLRVSFARTKSHQLKQLNFQYNNLLDVINQRDAKDRFANNSEVDILSKYSAAIAALENEIGVTATIEVCKKILDYLRKADYAKALEFGEIMDTFIKTQLK